METMRDLLLWYNNLDVVPFLEALEKQTKIYEGKGIDMLKSAISLPGLAVRWLFTEVGRRECEVALLDEENKDLHHLIKENLVEVRVSCSIDITRKISPKSGRESMVQLLNIYTSDCSEHPFTKCTNLMFE